MKDKYLVSLAQEDSEAKGIDIDGKLHEFSESGHSFYVSDAGKAKEIEQSVGQKGSRKVMVSKVPQKHNYFFSIRKKKLKSNGKSKYVWVKSGNKEILVKRDGLHAE
ncbi:MAG: hypothetical protein ACW99U_18290 [Candidatus Thorarchaeota archaeon]|jgi:hypothetical protein